jgi:hypothetical protein
MNKSHQKIALLLLLALLYASFLVVAGFHLWEAPAPDFPSFYFAPRLVFEAGLTPYSHENWAVVYTLTDIPIWPFLYPPPSLLFFRLLNSFSYETAKILFLLLNHLLVLAFIVLFIRRILRVPLAAPLGVLLAAYILNFRPIFETLRHGQVNLIVLLLVCLTWYFLQKERHPAFVALPLALAILLKVYPVLLIVYFLIQGRYRIFLWNLGFLVLFSALTMPFLPVGIWTDWQTYVASGGYGVPLRGIDPAMIANQSINGFTSRFFLGRGEVLQPVFHSLLGARWVPFFLSGAVGLVSLVVASPFARKRRGRDAQNQEIALFLLTISLAAPIVWEHQLVGILPAILIAFCNVISSPRLAYARLLLVLLLAGLLAFLKPLSPPFSIFEGLLLSTSFFASGILWLYFALDLWPVRVPRPAAALSVPTSKTP